VHWAHGAFATAEAALAVNSPQTAAWAWESTPVKASASHMSEAPPLPSRIS